MRGEGIKGQSYKKDNPTTLKQKGILIVMAHFYRRLIVHMALIITLTPLMQAQESITLGFVGDIMMHNTQLRRAWLGEDENGVDQGYNFHPAFEWAKNNLASPDLTIANFETTLGGPNSALVVDDRYGFREYQAYPTFTTPDTLAQALSQAGIDVVSTANNHCLDSGIPGLERTITILEEANLHTVGTSKSGFPTPWRGRVQNLKISLLAWTASTNGLIFSKGMEQVNVFNATGHDDRLEDMLAEIRNEASQDSDFVILLIHWGQEYMEEPDQYQKNLAQLAIEAGVDIIIGSHPHTLQPIERRIVERNGQKEEVFIAWSLGNYISSQRYVKEERPWVDGSAMLQLQLEETHNHWRVSKATFLPVYSHWTPDQIRVLPLHEALNSKESPYPLSAYDQERIRALDAWIPTQLTRYLGNIPAHSHSNGWTVQFPSP